MPRMPQMHALADMNVWGQGMLQASNFNKDEALAVFSSIAEFAPETAMLHFGMAYAKGVGANRYYNVSFTLCMHLHPYDESAWLAAQLDNGRLH